MSQKQVDFKHLRLFFMAIMAVAVFWQSADAQFKLPFGRSNKNTTPESLYLTQKAGPWLIMCTSFTGEDGRQQALRLAKELRERHRLNAYVYGHKFDFREKAASSGRGYEKYVRSDGSESHRPIRMRTAGLEEFEEFAVLVGDFASVADSKAQTVLEKIKYLRPESLAAYDVEEAAQGSELAGARLRAWRDFAKQKSSNEDDKFKGPMKAAFLLPNPSLPDEYFNRKQVDEWVIKYNKDREYSLLKNPGNFTVRVATFTGESTLELQEIDKKKAHYDWLKRNRKSVSESKLMDAEKKAIILTAYLRSKDIEAYEFHDRHESIVCVGGFDWNVQTKPDGRKVTNEQIAETILKFKGKSINVPNKPGAMQTYKLPKKLAIAGIACDIQPLPVIVPKHQSVRQARGIFSGLRR